MNDLVEGVTKEFDELAQPYLGRQEYGDLRRTAVWGRPFDLKIGNEISWYLNYEDPTGSSQTIIATYDKDAGTFKFADEDGQKTTSSQKEVLEFLRRGLDSIKSRRLKSLQLTADIRKKQGDPLEIVLERVRQPVREKRQYAATAEELKFYERYCREIYTK